MTTLTLITLLAICCIVMAAKEYKKSKEAYLKYKLYYEEYRKMFGTHTAMKQAYSEWTDHLFLFLIYSLLSATFLLIIYSAIISNTWKVI